MDARNVVIGFAVASALLAACRKSPDLLDDTPTAVQISRGSVKGRVLLQGTAPPNQPLRMHADPMCARANGDRQVLDDAVTTSADGGLANVFVQLDGTFPESPVPQDAVRVDQRGCVYRPRVVGMRVGQALEVHNSDDGLHNVHGSSPADEGFNVSQPLAGMTNVFRPRQPGMLNLKCDVHTWMVAFVGVVNHPYFAVTDASGMFTLQDVPIGTYTLRAWHEVFGVMTTSVRVDANASANATITFDATRPRAAAN